MTYLNYEDFDKAILIGPLFKKLDEKLSYAGSTWTAKQLFKVKCYAQDARDFFKEILVQSLQTAQEYHIDTTCYPSIALLYPSFTKKLGDPFLDICLVPTPSADLDTTSTALKDDLPAYSYSVFKVGSETATSADPPRAPPIRDRAGTLENIEKLVCLILFSEHMIAFCDLRWAEVDTSGIDHLGLLNTVLDDDDDDEVASEEGTIPENVGMSVQDLEALFQDRLKIGQCGPSTIGSMDGGMGMGVTPALLMV